MQLTIIIRSFKDWTFNMLYWNSTICATKMLEVCVSPAASACCFCLSAAFPPFSSLDWVKLKCFQTLDSKLDSTISQTFYSVLQHFRSAVLYLYRTPVPNMSVQFALGHWWSWDLHGESLLPHSVNRIVCTASAWWLETVWTFSVNRLIPTEVKKSIRV